MGSALVGWRGRGTVSMLSWFRALMPKEERFFHLFTRHAEVTLAGAQALRALLKGDDVVRCCGEITKPENEADKSPVRSSPRCGERSSRRLIAATSRT